MYVFDLDGTIALNEHRQHYLLPPKGVAPNGTYKKDWDSFNKACVHDEPCLPLINVMRSLKQTGYRIAILSGRGRIMIQETRKWLEDHFVPYDYLDMRPIGDHRDDCVLKLEMIKRLEEKFYHERVHAVFDDRQKVVDMWRREGYRCFQVAPGAF